MSRIEYIQIQLERLLHMLEDGYRESAETYLKDLIKEIEEDLHG